MKTEPKIRYLRIGSNEEKQIRRLMKFAHDNHLPWDYQFQLQAGKVPPIETNPDFCLMIPDGFCVIYYLETYLNYLTEETYFTKHLKVNIPGGGYPAVDHVNELLFRFMFESKFSKTTKQPRYYNEPLSKSINVMEKYRHYNDKQFGV